MKTLILALTALAASGAAAGAPASRPAATLTIRHEQVGCHRWSLNGGPYRISQTVSLHVGDWLRVINHDGNVHRLVQTSGGSLTYDQAAPERTLERARRLPPDPRDGGQRAGVMDSVGASALVTFNQPGLYTLSTIEGPALAGRGAATRGIDNTLELRVLVQPRRPQPRN